MNQRTAIVRLVVVPVQIWFRAEHTERVSSGSSEGVGEPQEAGGTRGRPRQPRMGHHGDRRRVRSVRQLLRVHLLLQLPENNRCSLLGRRRS